MKKKYRLFISHKHADSAIALCLAEFFRVKSLGKIEVHLSSAPNYRGPPIGEPLTDSLKKALSDSDALVLLYTTADKDWSYCMWECGVATDPKTPHTNIYVIQCGDEVPSPFAQDVRVDARDPVDLQRFVTLLLSGNFFPNQEAPLANDFQTIDIKDITSELRKSLPLPEAGNASISWSNWPRLEFALPVEVTEGIKQSDREARVAAAVIAIRENAVVCGVNLKTAEIFGVDEVAAGTSLSQLADRWSEAVGDPAPWLRDIAEQVVVTLIRGQVAIGKTKVQCVATARIWTPVLVSAVEEKSQDRCAFKMFFLDLVNRSFMSVQDRMIPIESAYFQRESDVGKIELIQLRGEMKGSHRNRLPVLTDSGAPLMIVHLSTIEQFLLNAALSATGPPIDQLTLSDLIGDEHYAQLVKDSFAVVPHTATVAEARLAMNERDPNCRDAFVTEDGSIASPVRGWLTNVDAM